MSQIIGQNRCREMIGQLTHLPQFTIILGHKGGGKTLLSEWISNEFGYRYLRIGNKIADIRNLIEDSISLSHPTIYTITGGDDMTTQASNALLKLSEEPTHNLYIILELSNLENTLPTIVSRAKVIRMDSYSYKELKEYYDSNGYKVKYERQLFNCVSTMGMIRDSVIHDFDVIYEYASKVYDNILHVTTGNSFKIRNRISFKEDDDKIPPVLFFNVFIEVIMESIRGGNPSDTDMDMIRYTNEARVQMSKKGANKSLIFDIWILNLRTLR